jgi:hypothetical protein
MTNVPDDDVVFITDLAADDPFAEGEPPVGTPAAADWTNISITIPPADAEPILRFLREEHGFRDVDWCVMQRDADCARVDYDPVPPLTSREFE